MNLMSWLVGLAVVLSTFSVIAKASVKGFTMTEIGNHYYDANLKGTAKTEAQIIADKLIKLGVNHIVLLPRAIMESPWQSYLDPKTPHSERRQERKGYLRFIKYLKSKGITVGIRPVFFVVDEWGGMPYYQELSDGSYKIWWRGIIEPNSPKAWYKSYQEYLDIYLDIATAGNVDEFTIGTEMQSMTIGNPEGDPRFKYGFPARAAKLAAHVRNRLGSKVRITYDVNYTDAMIDWNGKYEVGGEMALWTKRLVDFKNSDDPAKRKHWNNWVKFWQNLDVFGIDMYRSLASWDDHIPSDYGKLTLMLSKNAIKVGKHLTSLIDEIKVSIGSNKNFMLKEVGFRSVENGFIDPFVHAGDGRNFNVLHQAAAYEAIIWGFLVKKPQYFSGLVFWDASVDLYLHGPLDDGYSPLGKKPTERVIRNYFSNF